MATQINGSSQIQSASISTDRLATGILSADSTGRALIASNFFDSSTVSAKFASASIADDRLTVSYIKADGTRAFTGNQSLGGNKITNLGTPTSSTDAVTKAYVDSVATGLDVKQSVRLATVAALPANTVGGSGIGKTLTANANGALSVDGTATVAGNRILVKDEATASDNGIYVVTAAGSGGTPYVLTRATDADENAEVTANMFTFVSEGATLADTGWVLTTNDSIAVDTTALTFAQFTATSSFTGDLENSSLGYLTDSVGDLVIQASSGNNVVIRTGDDVGSAVSIRNSSDTILVDIQSTGTILIPSAITQISAGSTNATFGSVFNGGGVTINAGAVSGVTGLSVAGNIETTSGGDLGVDGTIYLTGGAVISTISNNNINLSPNGTGRVLIGGLYDVQDTRNPSKAPVRAASTGNLTLSGTQTVDGVSLIAGDRILVKDQTTGSQNGIYVVAAGSWSRSTDFDVSAEAVPGSNTFVSEGTANGNKVFHLTTDATITLGTTSLTFSNLVASSSFSGDISTTSQGYLSHTGSTPVTIRDDDGLKVANGADTQSFNISASAANEALLLGSLVVRRDAGLVLQNTATTAQGSIIASAADQLSVRATDGWVIADNSGTNLVKLKATGIPELTIDGKVIVKRDGGLEIQNNAGNIGTVITSTGTGTANATGAWTFPSQSTFTSGLRTVSNVELTSGSGAITTTANGDLNLNPNGAGEAKVNGYVVLDSRSPWKYSVRAATTANLAATRTSNTLTANANGTLPAIDGVTLVVNDRVLVKDQTTGADNGIYKVSSVGSGGTPYVLDRTTDADSSLKIPVGMITFVSEGTSNGNKNYQLTTDATITLNTTSLVFGDAAASSSVTAGNGITVSGTTVTARADTTGGVQSIVVNSGGSPAGIAINFDSAGAIDATASGTRVKVDSSTIEISSNALRIKDAGVTFAKLANAVSDRLGRYDRLETVTGSTASTQDLAVTDANGTAGTDSAGLLVYKNGMLLSIAAGDYDFSDNGGSGGVDRITGLSRLSSDRMTFIYKRTGSAQ